MSERHRSRTLIVGLVSAVFGVSTVLVVGLGAQSGAPVANKGPGPVAWVGDISPIGPEDWSYDRAAHLLERAGFGGTPEEIQRLASMTPAEAVDSLVDYGQIDNSHLPPFDESGIYDGLPPSGGKASSWQGTTTVAGRAENAEGGVGGVPLRGIEVYLDVPGHGTQTALTDDWGRFRFEAVPLGTVTMRARGRRPGRPTNVSYAKEVTLDRPDDYAYVPLLMYPTPDNDDGSASPDVYGVVNQLRSRDASAAIRSGRPDLLEVYRLEQWWAERMLTTRRPLEEKLVLFWHGHFANSADKVADYRLVIQQLETIRTHAAGNFAEFLTAMSKNPAMLIYLDGNQNVKGQFNENFAREIMELFSLGLDNYTEDDIKEAARAFTGWTNVGPSFLFNRDSHDPSEKLVFGKTGHYDGDDIIALILDKPASARFIARKMMMFFVRGEFTPELEERLAAVLRDNDYELKPLLRTLFLSKDFYSPASMGEMIKAPVHFTVSTYRKLGVEVLPTIPDFRTATVALGQELLFPPNVSGWNGDKDSAAWINPGMFFNRANFANSVLFPEPVESFWPPDRTIPDRYAWGGEFTAVRAEYDYAFTRVKRIPRAVAEINLTQIVQEADARTADAVVDHFILRFLPTFSPDDIDRQRIVDFLTSQTGGQMIDLGPDDTLEETLRQVVHLIMSMPEYNVS